MKDLDGDSEWKESAPAKKTARKSASKGLEDVVKKLEEDAE